MEVVVKVEEEILWMVFEEVGIFDIVEVVFLWIGIFVGWMM